MQNDYRIVDFSKAGLPFVEVHGEEFSFNDLYELVGKNQFMTTFNFKRDSDAYSLYGESVVGIIYYNHDIEVKLRNGTALDEKDGSKIHVTTPSSENLSIEQVERLKYEYGGFLITDIESISFLPFSKDIKKHTSGEKKVPNIINIEVDCQGIDPDVLCQSYLIKKNNDGVRLILFEKEKLIGITLAINNKRMDSGIIKHLGFTQDDVSKNINVWYHYYQVKERRGKLTNSDIQKYSEIKSIINTEILIKIMKELVVSGVREEELANAKEFLDGIFDVCSAFKPNILLHGKKQVYWDLDAFIHIFMRHVQSYQLGNFKNKTAFSYKESDLKDLIEKVLGCVEDEFEEHTIKRPDSMFTRQGRRAVFFNGDHYNLRIESDGRLSQFHPKGEIVVK